PRFPRWRGSSNCQPVGALDSCGIRGVPLKYYGPYQHSPIEPSPQVSEGSPLKRVILSVIVGVGKINLQTDLRANLARYRSRLPPLKSRFIKHFRSGRKYSKSGNNLATLLLTGVHFFAILGPSQGKRGMSL